MSGSKKVPSNSGTSSTSGALKVVAYNNDVVSMIVITPPGDVKIADCAGFQVTRTDEAGNVVELKNPFAFKTGNADTDTVWAAQPTSINPVQAYTWRDFSVDCLLKGQQGAAPQGGRPPG